MPRPTYSVREQAAAIMQARLPWPQADALALDLERAGLLAGVEAQPLRALRAEFAAAVVGGASSNDVAQLLDDFLVKQGLPSVLYA